MSVSLNREARGRLSHHAGVAAEESVIRLYRSRGHALLAHRWRGAAGELDVVMRAGGTVVFVEVKHSKNFPGAAASLTERQIGRLLTAASEFLGSEPAGLLTDARFDLALVDGTGEIEIHENALGT
ncbi:MAG: YraN family protein [Pseudomonadota bacterium]